MKFTTGDDQADEADEADEADAQPVVVETDSEAAAEE